MLTNTIQLHDASTLHSVSLFRFLYVDWQVSNSRQAAPPLCLVDNFWEDMYIALQGLYTCGLQHERYIRIRYSSHNLLPETFSKRKVIWPGLVVIRSYFALVRPKSKCSPSSASPLSLAVPCVFALFLFRFFVTGLGSSRSSSECSDIVQAGEEIRGSDLFFLADASGLIE